MDSYLSDRNYIKTETNFNLYNKKRIRPNNLFRNFLVKENAGHTSKYFHLKKKEILPEYTNINKKINYHIKQLRSYFDIENTIFKEIKEKQAVAYSRFKKGMRMYFFGPKGTVTQKNIKLKKFYEKKEKKKVDLSAKIYAGRWEYYDDSIKYNSYMDRLKTNRKRLLNMGGNFSTEDDINNKIHAIYLKEKEKEKNINSRISDSLKIDKNALQKKLRRFSVMNNDNQVSIYTKNFFEYTSIDPHGRKGLNEKLNDLSSFRSNSKLQNVLTEKNDDKNKVKSITSYKTSDLKKIKNIFKREYLERKIRTEKKKYFKKLKHTLNFKLDSFIEPSEKLCKTMKIIKIKNETNYNFRKKKMNMNKDDIKVIGEDDKKINEDNVNDLVKANYKNKRNKDSKSVPTKIYFSYYDESRKKIHKSIKEFIKNIWKQKEEERERKYFEKMRVKFEANRKLIKKLCFNLENTIEKKNQQKLEMNNTNM